LSRPPSILIVCALASELDGFVCPAGAEIVTCGVGPVEAAAATAQALAGGRYEAVVNAGIAGVFPGRGRVGDAFVVADETLADFGLEGGATLALPDGVTLVQHVRSASVLLEAAVRTSLGLVRGVTVSAITTTDPTALRLREAYGADVESMEGFAVLRAAERAGIPAIEVRGISNFVGDRARAQWDFRAGSRAAVVALSSLMAVLAGALGDRAQT
jgi:futalosine hydrolase